MFVVIPQECYKKKDFGFPRLSPCVKDLIAHMIGIENVVQNVLRNIELMIINAILQIFCEYYLPFCVA